MANAEKNGHVTTAEWAQRFGEWLTLEMDERNYTAADLARRTDLTRQMIGKWRHGYDRPSPTSARKLAEVFGLNPLDVMAKAGHLSDTDPARNRLGDLLRFVPDDRLSELERFIRFLALDQSS